MTRSKLILGTTALASILTAGSAFADITANDVWGDWREYMESFGYDVSATETRSGDTLTVEGLSMTIPIPEENSELSVTMGELNFTEASDGTVNITYPTVLPLNFVGSEGGAEMVNGTVNMGHKGLTVVASGDPSDISYNYSASEMTLELADFNVEGEKVDFVTFSATMSNITGHAATKMGALRSLEEAFHFGSLSYDFSFDDPESDDNLAANGTYSDLNMKLSASIPDIETEDPLEMFNAGLAFNGSISFGSSQGSMSGVSEGSPLNVQSSYSQGGFDISMDKNIFNLSGGGEDGQVTMTLPDLPLPISYSIGSVELDFQIPLAKSDTQQDFTALVHFGDLSVDDFLWNLFDPGQILPRDPASATFDLSGKLRLLTDLMDPAIQDSDDFPGELHAMSLNSILLQFAGAKLTGTGDFTFDNSDLTSFDGMPKPTGAIDLNLKGGNGLLDKLVQMGLIPEDQAMGARMMMGLFAVPGAGEDELNSKIEVNDQGHVLANGQRIQ